jgi:general secretion pathway protein I
MAMSMRRARTIGFTLVEVLVALVIVSIGMVAVIQAVGQAASNSAYLRDKTLAQWVALNQLTLMRLAQAPPTKGTSSGEAEMAGTRWKWTAEVVQTPIESMKRIDIGVRPADADEQSQIATITGFYGERTGKPGTIIAQYTPAPPTLGSTTGTTTSPTTSPTIPTSPTDGKPVPPNTTLSN